MSATAISAHNPLAGARTGAFLSYAIFVILAILLINPAAADMTRAWQTSTYHHGFFVAPLALFMIWSDRARLAALTPAPMLAPAIACAGAALLWVVAHAAGIALLEQVAFVTILIAGAAGIFGRRIFRALAYPLAFLYFMVPFGESLIPPLQQFTVAMVAGALAIAGLPASLDGVLITTSAGAFNIAEACAGLHFLIAATMIAAFFAHMAFRTWRKRLLFMALAAVFAVVANGLRASLMVVIATLTDMRLAVGDNHLFLGWICYTMAFAVLLLIGRNFSDPLETTERADTNRSQTNAFGLIKAAPLFIVLVAASLFARTVIDRPADAAAPTTLSLVNAPGWRITPPSSSWRASFSGADRTAFAAYGKAGTTVHLAIGYYTHDRAGSEIVNFYNRSYDGDNWRRAGATNEVVYLFGRAQETGVDYLFGPGGQRLAAVTAYWLDDRIYLDPVRLKWAQLRMKLTGANPRGGLIMMAAPYGDDPQTAIDAIRSFTLAAEPLEAWLSRIDARVAS